MRARSLAVLALLLAAGCAGPVLDEPAKVRHSQVTLPPLFSSSASEDGTSYDWDALFWLWGRDVEAGRSHTRVLPFYWSDHDPPFRERTLWFPFWYQRDTPTESA